MRGSFLGGLAAQGALHFPLPAPLPCPCRTPRESTGAGRRGTGACRPSGGGEGTRASNWGPLGGPMGLTGMGNGRQTRHAWPPPQAWAGAPSPSSSRPPQTPLNAIHLLIRNPTTFLPARAGRSTARGLARRPRPGVIGGAERPGCPDRTSPAAEAGTLALWTALFRALRGLSPDRACGARRAAGRRSGRIRWR